VTLLVRTPDPYPSESLFGFLLRVSESNGYDNFNEILRIGGLGRKHFQVFPGLPIQQIAGILGLSARDLSHLAYRVEEGGSWHFNMLGHDLGRDASGSFQLRTPRLCTQCVEEDKHIDAFWDLALAIACPRHGYLALDHCHACDAAVRWHRPGLLTCNCHANWANAMHSRADVPTIELMNVISTKLHHGEVHTLSNDSGFPLGALASLPLRSLLRILDILGKHCLWSRHSSSVGGSSSVVAAASTLEKWPHGYHRFLTDFGTRMVTENPLALGLRKQFGPFYEAMFRSAVEVAGVDFLRSEFFSFGLNNWSRTDSTKDLHLLHKESEDGLGIKDHYPGRRSHSRARVMRRETASPAASRAVMTGREAARYLGLPVSVLQHLRHIGVFESQARSSHRGLWHQVDVSRFLERGLAAAGARVSTQNSLELKDLMRLKLRNKAAKADIVAAVYDGRLTVVGSMGQNLGGLQFDKEQVDRFVLDKRIGTEKDSYSLPEAASKTGLDPAVVRHAVGAGLLTGVLSADRMRVTAESIDLFNRRYEPVAKLATRLGTTTRHLLRIGRRLRLSVFRLRRVGRSVDQPILDSDSVRAITVQWELEKRANKQKLRPVHKQKHVAAVEKYLQQLKESGDRMPLRGGKLNKVAVARACGFSRGVLYRNEDMLKLLDSFEVGGQNSSGLG